MPQEFRRTRIKRPDPTINDPGLARISSIDDQGDRDPAELVALAEYMASAGRSVTLDRWLLVTGLGVGVPEPSTWVLAMLAVVAMLLLACGTRSSPTGGR